MPIHPAQPSAQADLGDVWLRDQSARLTQKYLQFGRHYRIDGDALLVRLARTVRTARAVSDFFPINRLGTPRHGEWMAVLPDSTEIIVADVQGKPSSIGIEKAISIVQSRAYLETRARQLLSPLVRKNDEWRLIAIDFGIEAQQHESEFLMCFAFQVTKTGLAAINPYVEVGFALPVRTSIGPVFILTIRTTIGFAR